MTVNDELGRMQMWLWHILKCYPQLLGADENHIKFQFAWLGYTPRFEARTSQIWSRHQPLFSETTKAKKSKLQEHTFIQQESSITLGNLITKLCQESIRDKCFIQATFSVVNVSFHQLFTPLATFCYILEQLFYKNYIFIIAWDR